jgi:hypothetical protein
MKKVTAFAAAGVQRVRDRDRRRDDGEREDKPPHAHDVSIIVLDKAQPGPDVPLPRVGLLDDLKKAGALDAADFVNVGYGTHEAVNGSGGKDFPFDGDRWMSVSSYSSLTQDMIHLHQKDNRDEGGTGYGDSGRPDAPERHRDRGRQQGRRALLVDQREHAH